MALDGRSKQVVGSTLVFGVLFATLTALRVWNLEPSTPVQSAIVKGTALLCVVAVTYHTFHRGDFIGAWILAFGPSLAYTVNLFVPVVADVTPFVIIAPLVSGAAIASGIAMTGYGLGKGAKRGAEMATDRPSS